MVQFIKKIVGFLFLSIIVLFSLAMCTHYIVKLKSNFKINDNISIVVLGHSHPECSINDTILKNSLNLSSSGESYFYTYPKLKKLISENPQIKNVFVEFTNNSINRLMDDWIWGYEKMSYYLHYYSPFMESDDFNLLIANNGSDFVASYSVATRKHLYRIIKNDFELINEVGGFHYSEESKVDEIIESKAYERVIPESQSVSETNLDYLKKIVEFCRANDVNIYLLRSPQHTQYPFLINESLYQNILQEKFNDVEVLDFDNMDFPNNHYLDLHHLNNLGAKKFSSFLNDLIDNGLFQSSNKQNLINESIHDFNININSN